jgi:hypothetical protein
MHKWDSFLSAADEWFITYSLPPALPCVKLFAIGHVVELYLKAANTKLTNDIERAIDFGHNIKAIWDQCKRQSINFMPNFEIKGSVFEKNFLSADVVKRLDKAELMHFLKNQEFYVIAKYLKDLKYLGAPLKSVKNAYAVGFVHPNPYWIEFLREIRDYIGHPQKDRQDIIANHLQAGDLPNQSINYLESLYHDSSRGVRNPSRTMGIL